MVDTRSGVWCLVFTSLSAVCWRLVLVGHRTSGTSCKYRRHECAIVQKYRNTEIQKYRVCDCALWKLTSHRNVALVPAITLLTYCRFFCPLSGSIFISSTHFLQICLVVFVAIFWAIYVFFGLRICFSSVCPPCLWNFSPLLGWWGPLGSCRNIRISTCIAVLCLSALAEIFN